MSLKYSIGLDVGSTTVKILVLNDAQEIIHSTYRRHFSDVRSSVQEIVEE